MDAYDLYKPFRNHLRQLPLVESLGVVRAYLQFTQFRQPLPRDVQADPSFLLAKNPFERGVFEWELELLAKEIILNSPAIGSKDLRQWPYFSGAINKLKELENNISKRYHELVKANILAEMHRIAHRQFPWQRPPNGIWLTRYYKIFKDNSLNAIIQRKTGLTTQELYTVGLALTGLFINKLILFNPPTIEISGLDLNKFTRFLERFASDLDSLRKKMEESQSYDQDYAYSFNPLRLTPIIKFEWQGKAAIMAPVPTFLFWRFTEGVYFEICNEPDFSIPFGSSFQKYVGEILEKIKTPDLNIVPEVEYHIGKNLKNTTYWILEDKNAALFIECKTKKLRYGAKIALADKTVLEEDLGKIADAVVQVYKTIKDWQNGLYPNYPTNKKKVYPVITTLEEWRIFGDNKLDVLVTTLEKYIRQRMVEEDIKEDYLEIMPYSICSVADLEVLAQIIAKRGIEDVMGKKFVGEKRFWTFGSFIYNEFPENHKDIVELFPEDYKDIHPGL